MEAVEFETTLESLVYIGLRAVPTLVHMSSLACKKLLVAGAHKSTAFHHKHYTNYDTIIDNKQNMKYRA
jgi:hypothetical protein